jgi:hypothetical protein
MSAPDDAPKSFEFLLRLGRLHMLQNSRREGFTSRIHAVRRMA